MGEIVSDRYYFVWQTDKPCVSHVYDIAYLTTHGYKGMSMKEAMIHINTGCHGGKDDLWAIGIAVEE